MGLGYIDVQSLWLHVMLWPSLVLAAIFGVSWLLTLVVGDIPSVEKP